ncbi:MAG: hypothetical protein JF603_11715 [Acidobacteria bacterium]|nr:hypothetical protein [Acidobacteriota bacterium]
MDTAFVIGVVVLALAVPWLLRDALSGGWRNRPGAGPASLQGGTFATFFGINGGHETNRYASDPEPLAPPDVTD